MYAVTLAVFVAFTGFTIVMPFLPLYVRQLGVTDDSQVAVWSGLIFGISPLLAGVLAPVWGAVADRHGRKPMFVRSLIAFVVVMALTGLATSVVQVFILRMLAGVFGGFGATAMAMVTVSAPEEKASGAIGRLQAAMMLTNATGPLLGGVLASTVGIRNTFFISSAMYAAGLAVVVSLFQEPKVERKERVDRPRLPFRKLVLLPALLPMAGVLFLSQSAARGVTPIYPLYIEALGAVPSAVALWSGVLLSTSALAAAGAAAAFGRLASSRSPRTLLLLSLLGGGVSAALLTVVQNVPQLLIAAIFNGLLGGGTVTLAYSVATKFLPEASRGAGFGLLSTGSLVGVGLSPFVAGLVGAVELRLVFMMAAVLYAGALLLALRLPASAQDQAVVEPQAVGGAPRTSGIR